MSFENSTPAWRTVRGMRFDCNKPDELSAAIERTENYISDLKLQLSVLNSRQRVLIRSLNDLKSIQAKQTLNQPTNDTTNH